MTKLIVGRFATYQQAINASQQLINNNIDKERMSLVAPNYQDPESAIPGRPDEQRSSMVAEKFQDADAFDTQPTEADRTESAAGMGAIAVGAASVLLYGLGSALLAGPMAAMISANAGGLDAGELADVRFEQMLVEAGIATSSAEARVYVDDVRAGSSLLAVEVGDEQRDMAADIFRQHGGTGLAFSSVGV